MKKIHTPGPWLCYAQTRGFAVESFDSNGHNPGICDVNGADERKAEGREINYANARLIAAAPELLAALERVLECHRLKISLDTNAAALEQARAAIAKAKGE